MNSLVQIDIPKRSSYCFHQSEKLIPGMEIYSLLFDGESQRVERWDYCAVCWEKMQNERQLPVNRGYWKSKIESKKSLASSRVERALILLRDLLRASLPDEAEIYVLSLFLAHARQVALRQEYLEGDSTYQLYEILGQEEYFTVKVLNLSTTQIEMIQKSLAGKLCAG
jgi:hypothetical protein